MKFLTPLFLAALLPAFAAGEDLWTTDLDAAARELPDHAAALGQVVRRFTSPDADLESLYRYLISRV